MVAEHIEDIIGLLFKYIRLLQNSRFPEWIFNEVVEFSHLKLNFILDYNVNNIKNYMNEHVNAHKIGRPIKLVGHLLHENAMSYNKHLNS